MFDSRPCNGARGARHDSRPGGAAAYGWLAFFRSSLLQLNCRPITSGALPFPNRTRQSKVCWYSVDRPLSKTMVDASAITSADSSLAWAARSARSRLKVLPPSLSATALAHASAAVPLRLLPQPARSSRQAAGTSNFGRIVSLRWGIRPASGRRREAAAATGAFVRTTDDPVRLTVSPFRRRRHRLAQLRAFVQLRAAPRQSRRPRRKGSHEG